MRPHASRWVAGVAALVTLAAAPVMGAGQIADALEVTADGVVAFSYATRPGTRFCGQAERSLSVSGGIRMERGQAGGADRCREGSALVEVTLGAEGVTDVRFLGPDERPSVGARDLGRVSAAESAEAFLQVARADAAVSADAIVAAVVADSVVIWPDLLDLARHRAHPDETRRSALFWLGQEAASAVTAALLETADDDEEGRQIREAAVFALSQRPAGESLPALRALAQEAEHADTRRSALFWLAQSDDPAVPDFFADILAGP